MDELLDVPHAHFMFALRTFNEKRPVLTHANFQKGHQGDLEREIGENTGDLLLRAAVTELTIAHTDFLRMPVLVDAAMTLRFLALKFKADFRQKILYPWLLAFVASPGLAAPEIEEAGLLLELRIPAADEALQGTGTDSEAALILLYEAAKVRDRIEANQRSEESEI